MKRDFFVTKQ